MRRAFALAAVALTLSACSRHRAAGGAGVGEACAGQSDCAAPLTCTGGSCTLPAGLLACRPGELGCDGPDVVQCDAQGLHALILATCPNGCSGGACLQLPCVSGARRCGQAGVETCLPGPDGAPGWTPTQACPQGCDATSSNCNALLCRPLDVRCSPTAPGTLQLCASDGSSWVDEPCGAGALCAAGACVPLRCTPGAATCDGNVLVTCAADGSGAVSQVVCPAGCAHGACVTTSACLPGQTRCAPGNALQSCLPDGSGYATVQQCPAPGCQTLATGLAACGALVCAPLSKRCTAQGDGVELCAGDGSGWVREENCSSGCNDGACTPPPGGCTAGLLRCAGSDLQRCDGVTWDTVAQCTTGCSGGACTGPSCAVGFTLSVPLPSCASSGGSCQPPADGTSTLLAVTSVITDAGGATIPDGTLVTVTATGGATIAAADADPTLAGTQVRALGGVVDFAFRAPPQSALDLNGLAQVTVSAVVTGSVSCAAAAQVTFVAPSGALYVAEDFTTQGLRDPLATTADWETGLGFVQQIGSEFGDGRDGAFTVPASTSWDLTTQARPGSMQPYAPVLRVTALGARSAVVEGTGAAAFQPGDEVLLIELQGKNTSNKLAAGAWELLTVAQSLPGEVDFTTAILGTYGEGPSANLSGEHVVLQRVPHFTDLTVPAGSSITASQWNGQRGGVVALRVAGTGLISGAVHADALGYRPGAAADSVHGQAGESFGGVAAQVAGLAVPNLGGGSGGYLCGDPNHLNQIDTWYGSGGSYGSAGASTCSNGTGAVYGTPSLTRLLFGSGSGSQEQNTHQLCTTSTCPGESLAGHPSAIERLDGSCDGSDCSAFSSCTSEVTTAHGQAIAKVGGPCDGPDCSSFAVCPDENVAHATSGSALPCATSDCSDAIYGTCAAYTAHPADGNACFNSCPGLQGAHSDGSTGVNDACVSCGCGTWSFHDCYHDECFNNPSHCGQVEIRREQDGCETTCSLSFSCPHSYDTCNSTGCGFLGLGSPCFQPVYTCWRGPGGPGGGQDCDYAGGGGCTSCSTCPHDEYTNGGALHCATNPGCTTNPGCNTHPGCMTCSGCDITSGSNSCGPCPKPWSGTQPGGAGGGILFFAVSKLDLSGGGRVSALGGQPAGGTSTSPAFAGGAGGSVLVRAGSISLATSATAAQISAAGGVGGGDGRVRLDLAGGAAPGAGKVSPAPYRGPFSLPQAQSRSIFAGASGTRATSAMLAYVLDASAPAAGPLAPEQYLLSADGGATFVPALLGQSVALGPTADVRWRVQLAPQLGAPASTQALLWLLRAR